MAVEFDSSERTFSEIKRLVAADPFEPFQLRVDGKEFTVEHPNCVGFHPEVPYLMVATRSDMFRFAVKDVPLVCEADVS